jgi:ABC-2 type transport system ATP-binding protein
LEAVKNLNLTVAEGEIFAFLGPNGAGKTTTIKLLTGLIQPTSGRAILGGHDIQIYPQMAKQMISYVPDFPFLYDKLTPIEFLQFVGQLYSMDKTVILERSRQLLNRFNLEPFEGRQVEELSHGTRQRVVIAAALLHDPKILIIDEPMVGLDPKSTRLVKDMMRERAAAGTTVFLSTHQLSVAEELADRIGILHQGQLVAVGTLEELYQQSGQEGALEEVFLSLTEEVQSLE